MANTTDVRKTQTVKRTQTSRGAAGNERPRSASGEARPSSEPKAGTENTENAGGKRPRRRMKKQVRRTLGGLFLASAIVVAAIPTPETQATFGNDTVNISGTDYVEKIKVSIGNNHTYTGTEQATNYYKNYLTGTGAQTYLSSVPFASERGNDEKIVYTSDDGLFQFVYMRPTVTNPNKVAVILGYNGSETSVTIPDTLEGFRKFRDNVTSSGYCLVSKNNEFLHYATTKQKEVAGKKYYKAMTIEPCTYKGVPYDANVEIEVNDVDDINSLVLQDGVYVALKTTKTVVPTPLPTPTADPGTGVAPAPDPTPEPYEDEVLHPLSVEYVTAYEPCYRETRAEWANIPEADLFYYDKNDYTTTPIQCTNSDHWRINADVAFIGQEYLTEGTDPDTGQPNGTWAVGGVITDPAKGVFANNPSLTNLTMGSKIEGIGDFAFYGCSTLQSVSFGPNLSTIGNGAFADCIRLSNCDIALNANIKALGKDAFYNCRSLTSFTTSIGLSAIGDSCFENCIALNSFNFADGGEVDLKIIGNHVFRGCTALSGIEFPASYYESTPLEADTFAGCSSLQYIRIKNDNLDFDVFHKDDYPNDYPLCQNNNWSEFLRTVPDSFYFEGRDASVIHQTCKDESIAFKYLDEDRYERKVYERDKTDTADQKTAELTYQINSQGEVIKATIDHGNPINLTIPEKIGPYGIDTIGESAFANICSITKVTIPASVKHIDDYAFKGCHNLKTVIFSDANSTETIGTDSFKTQDCLYTVKSNKIVCSQCSAELDRGTTDDTLPELTFCGSMINNSGADTVPFVYAMNGQSNINNNDQGTSWIKYHSEWPTNLTVQYDYNSITGEGKVELIDYPRYSQYGNGNEATAIEFVKTLPYVYYVENPPGTVPRPDYGTEEYLDNEEFYYYVDLVTSAVQTYQDYKAGTGPAPTGSQLELINAALNIAVPTNVDAIDESIFSGVNYDLEGYPIYVIPTSDIPNCPFTGSTQYFVSTNTGMTEKNDGCLIYTDGDGKFYTDSNKSSEVEASKDFAITRIPYISAGTKNLTNREIQTITLNGVDQIDPYTFYGCTDLREASVIGADDIGDYAFDDCLSLMNVTIGPNVTDVGLRPFRGCEQLSNITCLSPDFTYDNGLLVRGGNELVECLEGRGNLMGSYAVGPNELSGITSIRPEAFMDCDNVGKVDLSTASLGEIPERCFRDAEQLNSVVLGSGVGQIYEEAFLDTPNLKTVTLPYSLAFIAQDAFADTNTVPSGSFNDSNHHNYGANGIIVSCVENSTADKYAKAYVYMKPEYGAVFITHNVYFWDNLLNPSSPVSLGKQIVNDGEDAVPPTEPSHDGYEFTGWTNYQNIVKDTDVFAQFKTEDDPVYTVVFLDYDGTVIAGPYSVSQNKSATKPQDPSREGYTFTGWKCTDDYGISYTDADCYNNVTSDRVVVAQYKDNSGEASRHTVNFYSSYDNSLINTQKVDHGESAVAPQVPTVSGYTFKSFIPSTYKEVTEDMNIIAYYEKNSGGGGGGGGGGGTASPDPTATATPASGGGATGLAKTYTVSVSGGSGSGNYPAGAVVAVNAYDMGTGQVFDKWTTSTAGVAFANPSSPSTSFVMPAANVAITATYRTGGSGSSSSTGSGGGSGSGSGGTATRNGSGSTTVDITKGGISNTNVAGATVSGSTDNFVVKITDDQTASEMALRALQNSYGDITRLKYLPMDISLYDSTGRTKIADTAGLSVSITMPLPTELAQYAGNNKIASVAGGTLDPLNSRFTTVDGVPCISFTATHFSPYVIWVDTGDLTESTIDYTPKTGDPIHPKWFLAIGLACISLVLFFKRDKKVKVTPA